MLLRITTTHRPATDLSYLLHKRPDRFQSFDLSFGKAHVFYPEASADVCAACLALDVDAVGLARGGHDPSHPLANYVNDRPYVASSLMSVAIAQVFGSAMQGRCDDRPELANTPIPLAARIDVLLSRGGDRLAKSLFEPLGYEVETSGGPLDDRFPEWGDSPYLSLELRRTVTLAELLTQLYVLIPVFDTKKHYYVGADEIDKLTQKGAGWLEAHPEKELIARRYLKYQKNLIRQALDRLAMDEAVSDEEEADVTGGATATPEETLERPISLYDQRTGAVLSVLRASGAKSVIDLGCGEGKLLRELTTDRQFERIVGMDVAVRALEAASRRLRLDRELPDTPHPNPPPQGGRGAGARIEILHGSLMYRDKRIEGFDAACIVEVIEHLDPPRLAAFERVVFEFARPKTVIVTTPNQEYNVMWETLPAGRFRHPDHRFEWTRAEFAAWAGRVGDRFGYSPRFLPVGPEDANLGPPTQMAVFARI